MSSEYEVTRAAVEVQKVQKTTDDIELEAVTFQKKKFIYLSLATIAVSFVHMFFALSLFSDESYVHMGAAAMMTLLVDVATWAVANYKDYAKRRGYRRSKWITGLFTVALGISMFLNGAYLWAHRPDETQIPLWMSAGIAITFALFVPMLIAVASLISGELEDDRVRITQQQVEKTLQSQATPTIHIVDQPATISHDETKTLPTPAEKVYGLRSPMSTSDIPGMVSVLRDRDITFITTARELGELFGFSSPASHSKVRDALLSVGVLRGVHNGYEVVCDAYEATR